MCQVFSFCFQECCSCFTGIVRSRLPLCSSTFTLLYTYIPFSFATHQLPGTSSPPPPPTCHCSAAGLIVTADLVWFSKHWCQPAPSTTLTLLLSINHQQARGAGSSESVADIAEGPDSQINRQAEVDDQKSLQRLKGVLKA